MFRLPILVVSILVWCLNSIGSLKAQVYFQENFDNAFVGNPAAPVGWQQKRIQIFGDEKPVPIGVIGAKDWAQNKFFNSKWSNQNTLNWDPISTSNNGVLWIEDALFGPNVNAMARRMESPTINLSTATSPYLFFNYFNASPADTSFPLIIVYSIDNGINWKPLMHVQPNGSFKSLNNQSSASINASSEWTKIVIPIPANLKSAQTKFGFQKNASFNQSHNLFIDSFSIKEFNPQTITSQKSGLWSNPDTWGGIVPNASNHVSIANSHTVEIDVNIARTQHLTIAGNLRFYSSSPSQVLQCFSHLTILNSGVYSTNTASNSGIGRSTYIGGNLLLNGNYSSSSNNTNAIFVSGASLSTFSGTGQFSNNRIARLYVQNADGVKIDLAFSVTHALYLIEGNLNPNGKLSIGSTTALSNVTIVKNGRSILTQRPLLPNLGSFTRSIFYGGISNGNMPSAMLGIDTIYTGLECDSLNAIDFFIPGNLTVNTSGILKLNSNLRIGNATVGGVLSLMRGLVLTSATKLLIIGPLGSGHSGVEPSKNQPYLTQGSYIVGPIRFDRGNNNSNTIYVPIGLGTDGVYSNNFNNQLKTIQLNPGTNWNSQSITFTCFTQINGPVDTGLTTMVTDKAYHLNLNGGNDLASNATIAIRGMNSNSIFSDKLMGNNNQVFIGQSMAVAGNIWKRRGNAITGTINKFENNQQYLFYSANTGIYSFIAPLASRGNFFSLVSNASNGTLTGTQVIKNADAVAANTKNAILSRVVLNCGGQIPLQLNQMNFNFNGTNRLSNIQSFKVFYGAGDSLFCNAKQYGNTIGTVNSTLSIVGNQQMSIGNNYFWIVADINSSAIVGDSIGINITSVNFNTFSFSNFSNAVVFKKINVPFTFISVLPIEKKTTHLAQNTFENQLLKIPLRMSSSGAQTTVTKVVLDVGNTVSNAWQKISQLTLYYSGNQNTWNASNKIGSVNFPNGLIEFSIPVLLNKDTNYFWLLADIEKYATIDDSFSIALKSIEFNGINSMNVNQTTAVFKIKSGYPISSALSNTDEEIWGVTLGNLNNQTDCNSIGGSGSFANSYSNYTALTPANLLKGNSYSLNLKLGSCAANNLSNAAVYIDYNQNNSFDDDGEMVYVTGVHNSNNLGIQFNAFVKIPIYAKAGTTRMRIIYAEQINIPASSGYFNNGETEDYTINLIDLPYQEYAWTGNLSKNYQTPGNWQPFRNNPNFNDKLVFNKGNHTIDSINTETIRCLELKDSCTINIQSKTAQTLSVFDSLILNQYVLAKLNSNVVFEIGIDTVQTGTVMHSKTGIYGSLKRWFNHHNRNLVFPLVDSFLNTHFVTISLGIEPSKYGAITCSFLQSNYETVGLPFQADYLSINKIYPKGYWKINSSNFSTGTQLNIGLSAENIQGIYNANKMTIAYRPWPISNWGVNGSIGTGQINGQTIQVSTTGNSQFGEFTLASDSNTNSFNNTVYIHLRCYLQSLYKGDGTMNAALKAGGISNTDAFADLITLNFWDANNPYILLGSIQFLIDTLGNGIAEIPAMLFGKNCYWEVRHRNSIATWSAAPISMIEACNIYDFTYGDYQAYGNNLFDCGDGNFSMFGGDVNQDGFVDGNDFIDVDNDNAAFYAGYKASDVNGDGFVDGNDFILIDNNNSLFVGTLQP